MGLFVAPRKTPVKKRPKKKSRRSRPRKPSPKLTPSQFADKFGAKTKTPEQVFQGAVAKSQNQSPSGGSSGGSSGGGKMSPTQFADKFGAKTQTPEEVFQGAVAKAPLLESTPPRTVGLDEEPSKGLLSGTILDPAKTQEWFASTDVGASVLETAQQRGLTPDPNQKLSMFTVPNIVTIGQNPKTGGMMGFNSKQQLIAKTWALKSFPVSKISKYSNQLLVAAGLTFMGLWAKKEAPEPITYAMGKALTEAKNTGDWTNYDEAAAQRDEIINSPIWEELMSYTPISPLINIPKAIDGIAAGAKVMDQVAADIKTQQETGESEADKWARVKEHEAQMDRDNIDYYNEKRKEQLIWEQEAKAANRSKEAAFWAKERAKQRALEAADRQAIADFWIAYRKEALKIQENSRPSKLNFGLL